MAATSFPVLTPLAAIEIVDTAVTNTAVANASGSGGTVTLFYVEIDNTANTATSYLKMVRAATATPSSTAPDTIMSVPGSTKQYFAFATGIDQTYITYWATSTAANGTSQTAPTTAITVRFLLNNA
tara:strand:- start:141 stop:518 length:378 start_codon:yes stop_codon:yes gene_type:complete